MYIYTHMFFYFKDGGGCNNFQGSIVSRILLNKIVVFFQYLMYSCIKEKSVKPKQPFL